MSSNSNTIGHPIIITNDSGVNILNNEIGVEIQQTKAFGVGIDVHKEFLQVSVLVKQGLSMFEYRKSFDTYWESTKKAKDWVVETIKSHSDPFIDPMVNFHYCIESTSVYQCVVLWCWKGKPSVINPSLAHAGKKKTDILDAKTLAIADLMGTWPPSYIPDREVQNLRLLIDARSECLHRATQVSNRIKTSLLYLGITSGTDSITKKQHLREYVEALLSDDPTAAFSEQFDDVRYSCPLTISPDLQFMFWKQLTEYDSCIDTAKEYLTQIKEKIYNMKWETANDEISGRKMMNILTSAPGIGELTAFIWLSRVITPRRFENEGKLAAYCGCDPSLKVSAGKVTSTVKRGGRKELHSALCQAASNLMRTHKEPFGQYGFNIAKQTGTWKKGVSAVARKIAIALYYMTMRGEPFSYEKYNFIVDPVVMDISIDDLAILNPSFKRYIRLLNKEGITGTKDLVHKFAICSLNQVRGLGKNFFALLKDFIEHQDYYRDSYERINKDATDSSI